MGLGALPRSLTHLELGAMGNEDCWPGWVSGCTWQEDQEDLAAGLMGPEEARGQDVGVGSAPSRPEARKQGLGPSAAGGKGNVISESPGVGVMPLRIPRLWIGFVPGLSLLTH